MKEIVREIEINENDFKVKIKSKKEYGLSKEDFESIIRSLKREVKIKKKEEEKAQKKKELL